MAQQPKRFAGTVALVTGAGRGIGRQVSAQLVAEGGRVVGVARTRAQLDAVEAELGDAFRGVAADLADPKACAAAADEGLIKLGGGAEYTYVVNCAGIGTTQPFLEVTPEAWDAIMAVNVRAPMFLTQAVARGWAVQTEPDARRAVVNVSSVPSGRLGMPHRAAYCSSKGALNQLTRCMALELGPMGVRVNSVSPTVTMTEMGRQAWADPAKSGPMLAHIPLGSFPEPTDVADAILWLLSDACRMIHGADVPVDGGYSSIGGACVGQL